MFTQTEREARLENRIYKPVGLETLRNALDYAERDDAIGRLRQLQEQGTPLLAEPERRIYTDSQKMAIYEQMNRVLALVGEGRPR